MIEIKNLHKAFGQNQVLKGVDITVNKGDVVVVIGPSGSGKTTMLRCINFLERADEGTITVGDITVDAAKAKKKEIHEIRLRTAMVFQNYNLFANKTALGNVMEGLTQARGVSKEKAKEIALDALEKVGLKDKADYYPSQLSGGQPCGILPDASASGSGAGGRSIKSYQRYCKRRDHHDHSDP